MIYQIYYYNLDYDIWYNNNDIIKYNASSGEFQFEQDVAGGSALINWCEHINLICKSEASDTTRLLKIGKSRHIHYPNVYFGLELDIESKKLSNIGIIEDWKPHLVNKHKKKNWDMILIFLQM